MWAEDRYLQTFWGTLSLHVIARKLGRGEGSVAARARKLHLRARHGIIKLHVLARESGYSVSRILGAVERLHLRVVHVPRLDPRQKRTPSHRGLDEEAAEAVLDYLATVPDGVALLRSRGKKTPRGVWGVGQKPDRCAGCKLSTAPHYAGGFCRRCYERRRSRRRRGQRVDDVRALPLRRRTTRAA